MNEIINYNESIFESIKHVDEDENEYWYARELMKVLEYTEWRKFNGAINKAIINCESSNHNVLDHFVGADKMVYIGSDSKRKIKDYKLSRYACYLTVLNCDSRKRVIALAKTYFAIQTRRQELLDEYVENQKRLMRREDLTRANKNLSGIAKVSGVKNYGKFVNEGYKGLYNGETVADIRKRKGLKISQNISDYMNSEELGANIFRATQTEAKLKRERIIGDTEASMTHYQVGKEVRNTIKKLGGTMPEKLPTPNKSIKELKQETKKIKINY